ncbi:MAG: radical SAM/SPASM domain-containing protein [Bacteroidetes bacterium]|nr:radical SAM/SPASM domain-containing protein [Bacteroidota bacterium]
MGDNKLICNLFSHKLINLLKIVAGYLVSRITGHIIYWGLPVSISIEPTNYCNLSCPECPSGTKKLTREKGYMDMHLFRKTIDQLSPALTYLSLYFQGEPFLHPEFLEMVRYAKSKGIYVSTSTNGHFLSSDNAAATVQSGLDKLIVSLDGTDQESYSAYRTGGSFHKVLDGIKEIARHKREQGSSKPFLEIQFLVLKTNQHQLKEIHNLCNDLYINKLSLKSAQHSVYRNGNRLMTDLRKYSRYRRISGKPGSIPFFKIKNRMPDHCFRMWSSCVITWDGKVVPCCFDKNGVQILGELTDQPFLKIWKGERAGSFRKQVFNCRKNVEICRNCTEGMGISWVW